MIAQRHDGAAQPCRHRQRTSASPISGGAARARGHARLVDIQLVAFPQSGVLAEPGAPDLLARRCATAPTWSAASTRRGSTATSKGQLDIVFGLAERVRQGLDIHLHDFGATGAAELRDIAARTIAAGLQGRVAVSHAFALGRDRAAEFDETAAGARPRRNRDHDLTARVRANAAGAPRLSPRGVTVFAGSDNIRDGWSPYGNGDMLDRAAIIAQRHRMYTDPELEQVFALATSEADKALGSPRRGLHAGAVADLVAVEAGSVADAVADRPPRALVLRAGRVAAERGALSAALASVQVAGAPRSSETEAELQLKALERALRAELGARAAR